jgi:cell wall-associated NlpC family hydrolase
MVYAAAIDTPATRQHDAEAKAPQVRYARHILAAMAFAAALVFATTQSTAQATAAPVRSWDALAEPAANAKVNELVFRALDIVGTLYKFGGNSRETGFDCSGFVRFLFDTVLTLPLPRTSFEMSRLGEHVMLADLAVGDLVFYNTLKRPFSHVGIYIGDGRFIHSPSRGRAVEIVDMKERYWAARFNGARRLLPHSSTIHRVEAQKAEPQNKNAASE